jgi:hypothetical protein
VAAGGKGAEAGGAVIGYLFGPVGPRRLGRIRLKETGYVENQNLAITYRGGPANLTGSANLNRLRNWQQNLSSSRWR